MVKEPQAIDFKELLHKANLRATPARLALLRVLQSTASPQTHAFLAESLEELGIDKATVFRNLNSLVEISVVRMAR
jgi:Fur family transcriptional regulator, ferric uptake regulator